MVIFQISDVVLPDSDHLLTAVLTKFDYTTGIKVYRSCREVQELLDRLRPRWLLPGSTLSFDINKDDNQFIRKIMYSWRGQSRQKALVNDADLKFLRVDAVNYVGHCPTSFLMKNIIPTMETLKGIKLLTIGSLEKEGLEVLFPVAGPKKLQNIDSLEVVLRDDAVQFLSSFRSRLFQLCHGPKSIRFMCAFGYSPSRKLELFNAFLEGWLAGEDIGRLELAVIPGGVASTRGAWVNLDEIVQKYVILGESVVQRGEEEYLLTRNGDEKQLILKKTGFGVTFQFSL